MSRASAARDHGLQSPRGLAAGLDTAVALGILAAVLAGDVASKAAARAALTPGEAVPIVDVFVQLRLGFNSGVAFGLLSEHGGALVWLTGLVALALLVWLFVSLRAGAGWRRSVPLSLIIGGAFGNLLDRLADGVVTDLVDIGVGTMRWPAFNLADSAIVVGVASLLLLTPRGIRSSEAGSSGGQEERRRDDGGNSNPTGPSRR